jgi:predicted phage tail component-like protein
LATKGGKMSTTIKSPESNTMDYDFLAFSFNGQHSLDDFHLYRTSDGDRYNSDITPTLSDITGESPSADGMYFFKTLHKQRVFNINFAFEKIDDLDIRNIKNWLNGKNIGDLWFSEEPYKVYAAKVTGTPSLKVIPFDETEIKDGILTTKRIYKGGGTV